MQTLNRVIVALTARNSLASPPSPPRAVALAIEDDPETVHDGGHMGYAEGQSFMIEYIDSKGQPSARRITVWGIKEGPTGVPVLVAKCHERNATRTFRIDRISCCIDYDGEVHSDVPAFMAETFGMDRTVADRVATSKPLKQKSYWSEARQRLKPHAEILSAISLSDGFMREEELSIAADHCLEVAANAGFGIGQERNKLTSYIRRLRPTEKTLFKAVDALRNGSPQEVTDLLIAIIAVMDMDGRRDPSEVELVNQLSQDLAHINVA